MRSLLSLNPSRRYLPSLLFSFAASSRAGRLPRCQAQVNTKIQTNPILFRTFWSKELHGKNVIACSSFSQQPDDKQKNKKKMKMEAMVPEQQEKQQQQSGDKENDSSRKDIQSNPKVDTIQQLVHSDSDPSVGWEQCWEQELTPWDLGQPTPVMLHLCQTGALPKGRALVPGCGSGHDVVAMASHDRYVVGLDISDKAIKKAIELSSTSPNADYFTFLKEDFFSWQPMELFDLIFDYTFFCAIEPNMRSAWASRMRDLLKPDGELITLMFPISDHVDGPPYKVSIADYEEVLHPMGFKVISIVDNELAVEPRKGREKIGRWKRFLGQSLL